jgi:hypothetical protein
MMVLRLPLHDPPKDDANERLDAHHVSCASESYFERREMKKRKMIRLVPYRAHLRNAIAPSMHTASCCSSQSYVTKKPVNLGSVSCNAIPSWRIYMPLQECIA